MLTDLYFLNYFFIWQIMLSQRRETKQQQRQETFTLNFFLMTQAKKNKSIKAQNINFLK
jgi:hypothetical protein